MNTPTRDSKLHNVSSDRPMRERSGLLLVSWLRRLWELMITQLESMGRANQSMKSTEKTLVSFSRSTILLLAHSLEHRNPEILLLNSDSNDEELREAGWLEAVPCRTRGVKCSRIVPGLWSQLEILRPEILSTEVLAELERYRIRKSNSYPWNWW